MTLLSYWEQHGYAILRVDLTSSPDSDPAEELAYNHRRLRQTVERAHMARDADGEGWRLSHVNEIESLTVRTEEGPEGRGVLHAFWAWKPPSGHHARDFYVPQDWLCRQWGRIHGPYDEHDEQPAEPLRTWIYRHGTEDYHSRENLAGYFVSQYLADHEDALVRVSWSWERSLGGSVVDTWEAIKSAVESMSEAVSVWHDLLGGERVELDGGTNGVNFDVVVEPPPNLGVSRGEIRVSPPDEYHRSGPDQTTVRGRAPSMPEFDGSSRHCPECDSATGIHELPPDHPRRERDDTGRVAFVCVACKQEYARPGEGGPVVVEREFEWARARYRQARLFEFGEWLLPNTAKQSYL